MQITVPSVFRCVASRNKRCVSHSQLAGSTLTGNLYPNISQNPAALRAARADSLPQREARNSLRSFGHPQASARYSPTHPTVNSSAPFGLSPIPPKPLRGLGDKAGGSENRKRSVRFTAQSPAHSSAARPIAVRRKRRAQRAPSSCTPPPAGGSDCATLRVATTQPNSVGFGLDAHKAGEARAGASGGPTSCASSGPRRGWLRPARLFESQELSPKHSLTAAPLSLRRVTNAKAIQPSPAGISSRFCLSQNE